MSLYTYAHIQIYIQTFVCFGYIYIYVYIHIPVDKYPPRIRMAHAHAPQICITHTHTPTQTRAHCISTAEIGKMMKHKQTNPSHLRCRGMCQDTCKPSHPHTHTSTHLHTHTSIAPALQRCINPNPTSSHPHTHTSIALALQRTISQDHAHLSTTHLPTQHLSASPIEGSYEQTKKDSRITYIYSLHLFIQDTKATLTYTSIALALQRYVSHTPTHPQTHTHTTATPIDHLVMRELVTGRLDTTWLSKNTRHKSLQSRIPPTHPPTHSGCAQQSNAPRGNVDNRFPPFKCTNDALSLKT